MRYFNVVSSDFKSKIGPIKSGSLFKNLSSNIVNKRYDFNLYGRNFNTKDGSAMRDFYWCYWFSKFALFNTEKYSFIQK